MVGSQLVGLVPLKALLDAAAFYCKKENLFILEEEHRIRLVGCAPERGAGGGMGASLMLSEQAWVLEAPAPGPGALSARQGPAPPLLLF